MNPLLCKSSWRCPRRAFLLGRTLEFYTAKSVCFFKQWSHWFVDILCEVHNTTLVSLVHFPVDCPSIQLLVQSPPDQGLARPVLQIQAVSEKMQLLRYNSLGSRLASLVLLSYDAKPQICLDIVPRWA